MLREASPFRQLQFDFNGRQKPTNRYPGVCLLDGTRIWSAGYRTINRAIATRPFSGSFSKLIITNRCFAGVCCCIVLLTGSGLDLLRERLMKYRVVVVTTKTQSGACQKTPPSLSAEVENACNDMAAKGWVLASAYPENVAVTVCCNNQMQRASFLIFSKD